MEIEFDPDKDAVNQSKHGLTLALAARMDLDTAMVRPDGRHAYGETRFQALGMIQGRLHLLAYTMRGGTMRAISLRKANARERKLYDEAT